MNPQRNNAVRILWAAFGVLAIVHLAAQLADADQLANVSQWFLMPMLASVLWSATGAGRSRLVVLTLVALGFSWLGDSAPDLAEGDISFLLMMGFFLLAQFTYIAAFLPYRSASVLIERRGWAAAYVGAVVALVAACAPGAGDLLVPALVYGITLGVMAALATGLNRWAAIGGAMFLVSDGLIALGAFADWFTPPLEGFWIMATYIVAQVLIVLGVLAAERGACCGHRSVGESATASA
ncbi:lysoplasmalogenase [Rhodococcus sp. ABRD24]|uniref:lysoplasmalogenase n=1 Tax=Rhodococcus sp. ABRD24 TaxID=2507582 RepID=UPI001F61C1EB|nr:lysoplasmalogenase [Rhodococcus sp. ABRD24]